MKHFAWIALVSIAALSPAAPVQDTLAFAEQDILKTRDDIEKTVATYWDAKMQKKDVQAAMKKFENDLKARDWSKVTGNEKVKAKLMALSDALLSRTDKIHNDCFGSMTVDEMRRDPPTQFSYHAILIASLDLRVTHQEEK